MADQNASNTERIRWVKSPHYVLSRVDGFTMDATDTGTVLLNFFVTYPAMEAEFVNELDDQDKVVRSTGGRDTAVIMEFQQGALIDLAHARELRDELNEFLQATESPGQSKKSKHASS